MPTAPGESGLRTPRCWTAARTLSPLPMQGVMMLGRVERARVDASARTDCRELVHEHHGRRDATPSTAAQVSRACALGPFDLRVQNHALSLREEPRTRVARRESSSGRWAVALRRIRSALVGPTTSRKVAERALRRARSGRCRRRATLHRCGSPGRRHEVARESAARDRPATRSRSVRRARPRARDEVRAA
jgi:hypothetical protein